MTFTLTLIDVKTGETRTIIDPRSIGGHRLTWRDWEGGEMACDRYRRFAFEPEADVESEWKCERYYVLSASPLPEGVTVADLNRHYPPRA